MAPNQTSFNMAEHLYSCPDGCFSGSEISVCTIYIQLNMKLHGHNDQNVVSVVKSDITLPNIEIYLPM
jgi:hypothetical protein